jgi:hypothetical protein
MQVPTQFPTRHDGKGLSSWAILEGLPSANLDTGGAVVHNVFSPLEASEKFCKAIYVKETPPAAF